MRKQLCDALVAIAPSPRMVFLTGDLGFMALEPLQEVLGPRFINAGVAEQNMVSVAAAMAREGMDAWTYTIAPFCYARAFEQIRNDVAFHRLPVRMIGNGGGYGYGVMGPTHHAIEDYGVLLTLPGLKVFVPVFDEDVADTVSGASAWGGPSYLRLGRGEVPSQYTVPAYAPWRCLLEGEAGPLLVVGPLAGTYLAGLLAMPRASRPSLWVVAELPLSENPVPDALLAQIRQAGRLAVAEEHVAHAGMASDIALVLMQAGIAATLTHFRARAHHYAAYGSQPWLRFQSGLDVDTVLNTLSLANWQ
jgi:transketolase